MAKDGLINCKKCGTLFFKTSEREICDECFKNELDTIDNIKKYINSCGKEKVTIDEISQNFEDISTHDLEDLVSRGRLFTILPKISIKCRFCGAELENDEKIGFTYKKCLMKFSPKTSELERKGLTHKRYEEEARNLNRRLRGGMNSHGTSTRYGFIQNYDL